MLRESELSIDKGLDFIARFNGKYVIGEFPKFLTDFGGHQNAQFNECSKNLG